MSRVRIACDACRRRKVRCNGEQKCQQCIHLGLECRFSRTEASNNRRNATPRGQVVSLFRSQKQGDFNRLAPIIPGNATSEFLLPQPSAEEPVTSFNDVIFIKSLLGDYETYVFNFVPIITGTEFLQSIDDCENNREACALTYALTAMTLNMRPHDQAEYNTVRRQVLDFAMRALETRGIIRPGHQLNTRNIMISVAACVCLLAHHADHDMAFFYLREAITCVLILNPDARDGAQPLLPQLSRLYWLLFVHERFIAISLFRHTILKPLASLPGADDSLPGGLNQWFICIIRLFSVIDDTFIANWLDKNNELSVELDWLHGKESQLSRCIDLSEGREQNLTDMQQVDLITTELWIRSLLWRIALSKLLLEEDGTANSMSIFFPVQLSRRLQYLLTIIPRAAFEVHGAGMLQKIFDITTTYADIVISIPFTSDTVNLESRIATFMFLHDYLHNMPRLADAERQILGEKRDRIRLLLVNSRPSEARIEFAESSDVVND